VIAGVSRAAGRLAEGEELVACVVQCLVQLLGAGLEHVREGASPPAPQHVGVATPQGEEGGWYHDRGRGDDVR
jgi:hypothetical protein